MKDINIPTVGDWYKQLPRWKQNLFMTLRILFSEEIAFKIVGYHRYKRTFRN